MNTNQERRPLGKVKVRVKRAGESPRVSAENDTLPERPDLLDNILPQALELEAGEKTEEKIETVTDVPVSVQAAKSEEQKNEPVVFVSVEIPENAERVETVKQFKNTEQQNAEAAVIEAENEKGAKKSIFTPFSRMSFIRKALTVLCAVFCLWSLMPLVKGICGIGLYAPLFIGLFALFTVTAWDFIISINNRLWKFLWLVIAVTAMLGAAAFAFVSGHMISASNNTVPNENKNITLVVLGCKVYGTEPSKMLRGRLDKAADYLLTHPGVNCIVTGGQGSDEDAAEAVVMKQYLVGKGVSASRIKTEDKSTSTRENMRNAIEVAKENNYYTTFCVVTDRFHQLRARMICNELEITSYALSSETPWYLTMYYWFREMFGIAHHTVYKN